MNEFEKTTLEKLGEKIPKLSKERQAKLAQIVDATVMVAAMYEKIAEEKQTKEAEA